MLDNILKTKLEEYEAKLEKVQDLVNKLPVFKDYIIRNELTENPCVSFGTRYKDLYFHGGIKRKLIDRKTNRVIVNDNRDSDGLYVFEIYVNTYSLYDSHNKYGLLDINKKVDVYFYDNLNTTFYLTDENIEKFLDELNEWYLKAEKQALKDIELKRMNELLEEKEKIINRLRELDEDE